MACIVRRMDQISHFDFRTGIAACQAMLGFDASTLDALCWLGNELWRWNQAHKLVGAKSPALILSHHIADSLAVSTLLRGRSIVDVGTGAGFPGLPLAIVDPGRVYTLVDGSARRLHFVRHAVRVLGLGNVEVLQRRTQGLPRARYDVAIARAYAPPKRALADLLPLVTAAGLAILMQAHASATPAAGASVRAVPVSVPGLRAPRWLWLYERAAQFQ